MPRRLGSSLLSALLLAVLALVLITPILTVVRQGFLDEGRFSLRWLQYVLDHPLYLPGLYNSVMVAVCTTALCLLLAVPLALLANSYDFVGKKWWLALIQVPLILPPFVGALGMKALLSRNGGINDVLVWLNLLEPADAIDWMQYKFWSTVVLIALYLYPITFLNVQAALANIDPALDEAARNLGSGPWRRFFRITLPLMRPGVFAGSTIVFIWAFTELGTPLMVGWEKVTAVQVFRQLQMHNPGGDAYALVVVMLVASVLLYLVGKLVLGRGTGGMMAKATVAAETKKLGWGGSLLVTLPFAGVFFVAVLPHIGVLLNSISATGMLEVDPAKLTLKHHATLLSDVLAVGEQGRGMAARSIANSFKYSIIATAFDLVLGFAIAYLVVRRRGPLNNLLDNLAMLPLAVPGLVMAFGYFAMTQEHSLVTAIFDPVLRPVLHALGLIGANESAVGQLNPINHDPTPLLVIAYATRRLPFLVRSCAAGLEQTSEALEESAINLGAGPLRTVFWVTIPLLAANFIAGALLVFSRSMLEVSDSLILAFDERTYPMTKAIWDLSELPATGIQQASALGVWGMVILIITIVGASLAIGKRLGALFRV